MRIARGISITNTSKPISTAPAYDADASAFFTAASITDTTQKSAVNTLVLSLKAANIWTKMKALYPIVGGSASSHAVNLKQPGTYNLSFATGWTHSSTGMTPLNTFADTFLTPSTSLSLNSSHVSFYSRTNVQNTAPLISDQTGIGTSLLNIFPRYGAGNDIYFRANSAGTTSAGTNSDSTGLFIANRISSIETRNKRNTTSFIQSSTSGSLSTSSLWLSRQGISSPAYDTRQCAFASIGDGLTDAEALSFYNAVQTYQTTLGRQTIIG